MVRNTLVTLALLCALTLPTTAMAQTPMTPANDKVAEALVVSYSVALGFNSVFLVPGGAMGPTYSTTALFVTLPVRDRFAIMPNIGIEIAPWYGNYGVFGGVTFDFVLSNYVALDMNLAFIHDRDPLLEEERGQPDTANFGFGPSAAFITRSGIAIGPGVMFVVNLEGLGWVVSPSAVISLPIR